VVIILSENKTNKFGEFLRNYRNNEKNMSLRDFAELIGISFSHLSKIERGEHTPSKTSVGMIAEALQLDKDKLLLLAGYAPEGDSEIPIRTEDEYDSLEEIKKLVDDYGIKDLFFHNIDDWKNLTKDDIDDIREYIEFIQLKAKKRKNKD